MVFKLAIRNVLRQRRRSLLTIGAIIAGFAFGSMSIGWRMGSFNFIIDKFTRAYMGHMQLHAEGYLENPGLYKYIEDYDAVTDELESYDFVISCAPRLNAAGLASVGEISDAVQVIGIDPAAEQKTTTFDAKIQEGKSFSEKPSHEAILGKGLMDALEAKIGDDIVVIVQAADGSIGNDLYKIIGTIDSGNESQNRMALYLNLSEAQELMAMPNLAHEIVIITNNIKRIHRYSDILNSDMAGRGMEINTWDKINVSLAEMISAKEEAQSVIQLVIMMIVAIGVLNTVLMSVLERTREFGVLKALGTRPSKVFRLIMTETFIMTVFGIIGGAIVGILLNLIISKNGIPLGDGYDVGGIVVDRLKSEVNIESLLNPAIVVFFAAIIVSVFPALRAARTDPAKTMRFH